MGLFDAFRKKNTSAETDMLDDVSYIAQLEHISGPWQQYDFLLGTRIYGWDYIVQSADYMVKNELENIGTVTVSQIMGAPSKELIDEFNACGGSISAMQTLSREAGSLGLGGFSKILRGPVKIVWINQSRVLRIFALINDDDLLTRYAETVIRRSFGTPDAMKKARPAT